jgi:hypothetical protein
MVMLNNQMVSYNDYMDLYGFVSKSPQQHTHT